MAMIEIQCTSCHTRYRIDERVLPAEAPTFKCSRCGHVFTTDPLAAKKVAAESSSSRASSPRSSRPPAAPGSPPKTDAAPPAPETSTSEEPASPGPKSPFIADQNPDPKPTPIKPYLRNPRPTVFDRVPEPVAQAAPTAAAADPDDAVDSEAVARMKASVAAIEPEAVEPTPPPKPEPQPLKLSREPENPKQDAEDSAEGENLEFDFSDERAPQFAHDEPAEDDIPNSPERWSVGDEPPEPTPPRRASGFGSGELDPEFSRGEPAPIGRGTIPQYAEIAGVSAPEPLLDEEKPDYVERARYRGASSFVGVFLAITVVFLVITGIIHGIPVASAELLRRMPVIGPEFEQPTPLENQLSVSDIQSSYQPLKSGQQALVVAGTVKNNSAVDLHTVQIIVRLLDDQQRVIASSAVYCGTTLSPRMIGEMTPHELEFFEKLEPQKAFALNPGRSAPFLMVFADPPRNLGHLTVAVIKAQPAMIAAARPASG